MRKYALISLLFFAGTYVNAQISPADTKANVKTQTCEGFTSDDFEKLRAELMAARAVYRCRVIDAETKEPVAFSNVVFKQGERIITGVATDIDGVAEMKLKAGGEYTIEWSSLGYKGISKQVSIIGDMLLEEVELEVDNTIVDETYVVGCRRVKKIEEKTITGFVLDSEYNNEPMIGANIGVYRGSKLTTGTSTNNLGEFSIQLPANLEGVVLEVFFIGRETERVEFNNSTDLLNIKIYLKYSPPPVFGYVGGGCVGRAEVNVSDSLYTFIDTTIIKLIQSLPNCGFNYNSDTINTMPLEEYSTQASELVYGKIKHNISIYKQPYVFLVIKETNQKTRVDYNGMYRFNNVDEGEYTLQVYLEGRLLKETKLLVGTDTQSRFDINLD